MGKAFSRGTAAKPKCPLDRISITYSSEMGSLGKHFIWVAGYVNVMEIRTSVMDDNSIKVSYLMEIRLKV